MFTLEELQTLQRDLVTNLQLLTSEVKAINEQLSVSFGCNGLDSKLGFED